MPTLFFQGLSDDTFCEMTCDVDSDNCASGEPIYMRVSGGGESLIVRGQYCPGPAGGWVIGAGCDGEHGEGEGPMPDWPMRFERSSIPYSSLLTIEAPEGARVEVIRGFE